VSEVYTVNLEFGRPTVRDALHHLDISISGAKAQRIKVLKLIHGYGSTGVGGKIKLEILKELKFKKSRNIIKDYIEGEKFSPFDERVQKNISAYPEMLKDKDYARMNYGITIVLI